MHERTKAKTTSNTLSRTGFQLLTSLAAVTLLGLSTRTCHAGEARQAKQVIRIGAEGQKIIKGLKALSRRLGPGGAAITVATHIHEVIEIERLFQSGEIDDRERVRRHALNIVGMARSAVEAGGTLLGPLGVLAGIGSGWVLEKALTYLVKHHQEDLYRWVRGLTQPDG
jgi:hypothetical protein